MGEGGDMGERKRERKRGGEKKERKMERLKGRK
jgi:hypothetical protein